MARGKPSKKTQEAARKAVEAAQKKRGREDIKPKTRGRTTKSSRKDPSDPETPKDHPKGRRLGAAAKSVRDTLIVERVALGWSWKAIAEEAGISERQAKRNYQARIKVLPQLLEMDPIKIVELLVQGFQNSILDFEEMAKEYADRNPSAAVGAKKAAVEARKDLAHLLQTAGPLPHDLGTVRHLYDVRVTVQHLIAHVEKFVGAVREIDLPDDPRSKVLGAADELRDGLRELAGEEPQKPPEKAAA